MAWPKIKRYPATAHVIKALELKARTLREAGDEASHESGTALTIIQRAMDASKKSHGDTVGRWTAASLAVYGDWCETDVGKAAYATRAASLAASNAHRAAEVEARRDLKAARECPTLEDLLTCERSAVRLAAMLTPKPEPKPPAPKRKGKP
jgi:hypothetical protein